MRAAFEGSYRRLDPEQALLFRLLAFNPGPDVATDSAGALIGRPVRSLLAGLARTALLREQPVGSGRWRMHDLIRLYAAELAEQDDVGVVAEPVERLLEHYETTLAAATTLLKDSPEDQSGGRFQSRGEALDWLRAERANLTAATEAFSESHPEIVVGIAFRLSRRLRLWRYFDDGVTVGKAALAAAAHLGSVWIVAGLENNLGVTLNLAGRKAEAVAVTQEAIRRFRALAEEESEFESDLGRALANLANQESDPEKCRVVAEEAITIGRRWTKDGDLTDPGVELAGALHNLSLALTDLGRHADGVAPAREALEIRRQQALSAPGAFEKDFADLLIHLSTQLLATGHLEEAVVQAKEGVEVFRRLAAEDPVTHEHALCDALARLGLAFVAVGHTEEARELHAQAMALAARLGENTEETAALTEITRALPPAAERGGLWHRIAKMRRGRRST